VKLTLTKINIFFYLNL